MCDCDLPILSAEQPVKPPTQVAAASGFVAFDATPSKPETIDWYRLVGLPAFQMYAAERMPNTSGIESHAHARNLLEQHGIGVDVYNDYCRWHKAKGYWPAETPMGELIEP